jgi:pantetheine-phosphate adenylyltransferase
MTHLSGQFPVDLLVDESRLESVLARWDERHRVWHGPAHLSSMSEEIGATFDGDEQRTLLLAAVYHDAIYDPRASDNEEASARLLLEDVKDPASPIVRAAVELIRLSKWERLPEHKLGRAFFDLDTRQLSDACPTGERLAYERAIFREYQFAPWNSYRVKRGEFLEGWADRFPEHARGAAECSELLEALQPRIALYPGSFNPFHLGHLSTLRQAEASFDKVIIGLGINRQKPGAAEAFAGRLAELQARLRYHEVAAIDGLVTRFLDALPLPATVVRGVRDGTDLEAELRYARFLDELRPETNVVWIACEPELQHLSSSSIRELESIEPGAGARYVPDSRKIYAPDSGV